MESMTKMKEAVLTATLLMAGCCAYAQDRDNMAKISEQYKNEPMIIAHNDEHLVITDDDGKLHAKSYVTTEKLLINEASASLYNYDYVHHSYFHKLEKVEGTVMVPDRKGYKSIKASAYYTSNVERESVFYDDLKRTEVSFRGVVKDAITKVEYSIEHKDLHFLPVFYFQERVPVVSSTFSVTVPKYVDVRFILKGDNPGIVQKTTEETRKTITYTWTANNVPKALDFDDGPSSSYNSLHLIVYVAGYKLPGDKDTTYLQRNVGDLNAYYYNFIKDINVFEDDSLNAIVEKITKNDVTQREKAEHIYNWVQDNMHYIAYEDSLEGFIPRQAAVVCKRKFGDCKDMSSVLVAMCRQAGLEAHFSWIGTRDIPYDYEEVPLPISDNHMICAVKLDGQFMFLDGTDPNISFGYPTSFIQGKEALVNIDKQHYEIVRIPVMPASGNGITDTTRISLSGGDITGTITTNYKGYPSWTLYGMLRTEKDKSKMEDQVKALAIRGNNKFRQDSAYYRIDAGKEHAVSIFSKFSIRDYIQQLGDEYYVNMNLLRKYEGEWVDTAKRKEGIVYKYKGYTKQVVVLDLPKGSTVSYLPPPDKKTIDGVFSYSISYSADAGHITLLKEYEINTLMVEPGRFAEYDNAVESLKKDYKESVVIKVAK